jgi:hypothetical protein
MFDNLGSHKAAENETRREAQIKQPFAKRAYPRWVHGSGRPSTLHC